MDIFVILVLFVMGLVIGSFVNVVIVRTLNEESFVKGRSRCDHCRKQIAWYDNIPLLSFLILGGKCRYCKGKIALQHLVVELTTGTMFVWWYMVGFAFFRLTTHPLSYIQPAYWLMVGILLLIVLVTDLTTYLIPDFTVILLSLLAFLYRLFLVGSGVMLRSDLWYAAASGVAIAAFFAALILATKGRGMGWGDVKLAMAMGLVLGWPRAVVAVFLAFIIGATMGIALVMKKKKTFGQVIPFGPFLVLGTILALIWGYDIWLWYVGFLI